MKRMTPFPTTGPTDPAQPAAVAADRPPDEPAGLRLKSGLQAGHVCEPSEFAACATDCDGNVQCLQKCIHGC